MRIFLISGDGSGAGKTALAEKLVGPSHVWSIAGLIRQELQKKYPEYDWFNKSQSYKDKTVVNQYKRGYSVREVLSEYGQERCKYAPTYWVERLVDRLKVSSAISQPHVTIAVDDVRKVSEINYFKLKLKDWQHYHVVNDDAVKEPLFDNELLSKIADYRITWK